MVVLFFVMTFDGIMTVSSIYRWNQRTAGVPATNVFAQYLDKHFDDERMIFLFPHMRDSKSLEELQVIQATPDSARSDS